MVRFDNPRAEYVEVNGLTGYVIAKGAPEDIDIGVFFYAVETVRCVPAASCTSLGLVDHAAEDHSKWAVANPAVKRRDP
jgi:hypothetical protein